MRILHVTLGFYPAVAWGGPVRVVHQNGRELVRRGHQVTVCCTNLLDKWHKLQPRTFEKEIDGIHVVYFDAWNIPCWPGSVGPIWSWDMHAWLGQELSGFDIVHLNGYRSPFMLSAACAARQAGVPIVTQPHGTLPVIVNSLRLKRLYDRLLGSIELEGISALIALQESERQQALAHGVIEDRIEVIPNGIDPKEAPTLPEWGTFRRRFGLALDRPLVLFLGRINRKKGADMLVEAFAQLRGLDAQLAIVGPDDGQLADVRHLIRQFHLDGRAATPGLLHGQDVWAAYQDADLFVLPCRADTFPMAIVEACLVGVPMVVTDRCEMVHLIEGRIADIVPFDTDAFAAAMEQLLTDRERHARYRANCPAVLADTFSIEAVVDRLEALYTRVIAGRKEAEQA